MHDMDDGRWDMTYSPSGEERNPANMNTDDLVEEINILYERMKALREEIDKRIQMMPPNYDTDEDEDDYQRRRESETRRRWQRPNSRERWPDTGSACPYLVAQ